MATEASAAVMMNVVLAVPATEAEAAAVLVAGGEALVGESEWSTREAGGEEEDAPGEASPPRARWVAPSSGGANS